MAKRGETRPYRIAYSWHHGVRATETRATLDQARDCARTVAENAARIGIPVSITITHRDTGETFPLA